MKNFDIKNIKYGALSVFDSAALGLTLGARQRSKSRGRTRKAGPTTVGAIDSQFFALGAFIGTTSAYLVPWPGHGYKPL
jgi:hypothetical protein